MTKKKEAALTSVHITCTCGHMDTYERAEVQFYAYSDECELCGSHGQVSVDATCKECSEPLTIELHNW